jgi:tRNA pseudouridine55 synthase
MSRRRRGRNVHGILLLDKPVGMSSNQALQAVRRLLDARKGGHTGSLDPFATGMLPLCFGEASKTAGFMLDADKAYRATACLGTATTTGDIEGEICQQMAVPELDEQDIRQALSGFVGEISQVPPMYSALKHQGRPLYELAREGRVVERKARVVKISRLELLRWKSPLLEFEVSCSKGTYIRTLAEDIARSLKTVAHLHALRRLRVGHFVPADMLTMQELEAHASRGSLEQCLLPVDAGLEHWPVVDLDAAQVLRFRHGNPVNTVCEAASQVRVNDAARHLVGLGEIGPGGVLRPRRVFQWD